MYLSPDIINKLVDHLCEATNIIDYTYSYDDGEIVGASIDQYELRRELERFNNIDSTR